MNFKKLFVAALAAMTIAPAFADQPFRDHRYDSFKATPTKPGQTVFVGNSITNMHSWFEAFGSHQEVIGRGNSGGFTTEVLANLESYIDSKPAKMFLMIGTNDISTGVSPLLNAQRVMAIVKRVRVESPETEIYVQTILPRSSNPKPDYEQNNTYLKEWIPALNDDKVHIIDLSEPMAGLNGNGTWSHDGLHPRPIGYATWCHQITDYVGYPTVYPETITSQESCGLSGSDAARAEQFPYFPVSEGDVLFFGDEQVHGGEWHELLNCDKIKDRGLKWGWGGIQLPNAKNVVTNALKDQAHKPAKIFLFYGIGGTIEDNYRKLVQEAKDQAPEAKIYLVSLSPSTNTDTNNDRVSFNNVMQTVASDLGCTYVDVYSALNADLNKNIMNTNYISGRGYVVMANELAKYLEEENVSPVSLEEYEAVYANRNNRKIIGDALTTVMLNEIGNEPGQIKESRRAEFDAAVAAAVEVLNGENLTAATAQAAASELTAAINDIRNDINMPQAGSWYSLTSSRGNLSIGTVNGVLSGAAAAQTISDGSDVWKFELRADGTYNILNANGEYIQPTAGYNTAVSVATTEPTAGFSLSNSNAATGAYVIYSGTSFQLNQTDATHGYAVFNWYNKNGGATAPDRADQGCAYLIQPYAGTIVAPEQLVETTGWYKVQLASNNKQIINLDAPVNHNGDYYSLRYNETEVEGPTGWIHIDYANSTRQIKPLNGFYIGDHTFNVRSAYNVNLTEQSDGTYKVQYWSPFNEGSYTDLVGRSSGANTPHKFWRISDEELAKYDIWTVTILGKTSAATGNDIHITYRSTANQGVSNVYNGGWLFVTPGTVIEEDDLTITVPGDVTQDTDEPVVAIDNEAKTIFVSYKTAPKPVLTILDKEIGATPYRVPDNLAKLVLNGDNEAATIAIEVTVGNTTSQTNDFGTFVAATDTTATADFFTNGITTNKAIAVRYIGNQGSEGWYTRANSQTTNLQVVYVHDPAVGYTYYYSNGNPVGDVVSASGLGAYGFHHFGTRANANALYLGGLKTADNEAKYMLNGTIHSVRFFNKALTADEINDLPWTGLEETEDQVETAISAIEAAPALQNTVFDLQGRRVLNPGHGIFIVNGKKVIR